LVSNNLPPEHYNAAHQAPANEFHPALKGNIHTGKPDKIDEENMLVNNRQGLAGVPVTPEKLKALKDKIRK